VTGAEPSRSVEVELKFDVDEITALPDWSALPGVVSVGVGEVRELDALYLDTAYHALARAGYALRRRTGGPDAGWHIKGPRDGHGRAETQWPLTGDDTVPDAVRAAYAGVTEADVSPLARIRNTRVAYALRDADGGLVAEFADDRVQTRDERSGVERGWREWEVELGHAGPHDDAGRETFFRAVAAAVSAVGGRPAASASKLARALGF
jgi:inorganic triphosphatase YgiF